MKLEIIKRLPMARQTNYYKYYVLFFILTLGLAQNDTLNVETFEISKSQEAEIVTISAIINIIDTAPTAYRFSIYERSHSAEPFIQRLFFPGEPIQIVLPINILSPDSLGNIAKLEPLGGKYSIQYRMFNKVKNEIILTQFEVLKPADIIKLTILDKDSGKPIPNCKIEAFQNGILLSYSNSDSLGYSRLRVPLKRDIDYPIIISINTEGKFQLYKRGVNIIEGTSEKIIELSSLKLDKGEAIYNVMQDLVPFRVGPENGSSVLFLLNLGDQVVVSKVAGDRLFGRVKVFLEMQEKYKNVNGWILHKHVTIKDI
jgi:hypothetical protein